MHHKLNSNCQYKKHESEGSSASTGLTSLKAKLKKLKKRVDGMEKCLTEPLLEEIKPPFTKNILDAPLPKKIKMPQIKLYGGKGDPAEHIETFRSWMEL